MSDISKLHLHIADGRVKGLPWCYDDVNHHIDGVVVVPFDRVYDAIKQGYNICEPCFTSHLKSLHRATQGTYDNLAVSVQCRVWQGETWNYVPTSLLKSVKTPASAVAGELPITDYDEIMALLADGFTTKE